jgi:hypothetical protein
MPGSLSKQSTPCIGMPILLGEPGTSMSLARQNVNPVILYSVPTTEPPTHVFSILVSISVIYDAANNGWMKTAIKQISGE